MADSENNGPCLSRGARSNEIAKIEQFTDTPRRGEIIHQFAVQAAQAINRFGTAETRAVAEELA